MQEYYVENGNIKEGTGSSLPVMLFVKLETGQAQIFDYKDAGEGYQYLTVNFPPKIQRLINLPADAYNQRVSQLANENWGAARSYFGLK